jgi:hypothetical protein
VEKIIFLAFSFLFFFDCFGSHLRGGQITVVPVDCSSNLYSITLTVYTNTLSPVHVENGTLDFGDGQTFIVPELQAIQIDPDNAVGLVMFTITHTYAASGTYFVSFLEQNRNGDVLNFDDNGAVPFYIRSYFTIDPLLCGHSISFTIPPTDRGCSGTAFTHNPGVVVPEGDSVSYQIVTPLMGLNTPVPNYQNPNAPKFYSANYNTSNEQGNGPPTFSIDQDGTLTWNAPEMMFSELLTEVILS